MERIISIDNELPTKEEREEIKKSYCLQCYKPFEVGKRIIFTTLSDERIIWWHGKSIYQDVCTHRL